MPERKNLQNSMVTCTAADLLFNVFSIEPYNSRVVPDSGSYRFVPVGIKSMLCHHT